MCNLLLFLFSRCACGGAREFLLIGMVVYAMCVARHCVFSAPHVAWRIACLWLRCRSWSCYCVSLSCCDCVRVSTCVSSERWVIVAIFSWLWAVGVTFYVGFERSFLAVTVQLSTYKFLRNRSVEAMSVAAHMRARGSSVLSALSLYI